MSKLSAFAKQAQSLAGDRERLTLEIQRNRAEHTAVKRAPWPEADVLACIDDALTTAQETYARHVLGPVVDQAIGTGKLPPLGRCFEPTGPVDGGRGTVVPAAIVAACAPELRLLLRQRALEALDGVECGLGRAARQRRLRELDAEHERLCEQLAELERVISSAFTVPVPESEPEDLPA